MISVIKTPATAMYHLFQFCSLSLFEVIFLLPAFIFHGIVPCVAHLYVWNFMQQRISRFGNSVWQPNLNDSVGQAPQSNLVSVFFFWFHQITDEES
jgi:hypothetical protein